MAQHRDQQPGHTDSESIPSSPLPPFSLGPSPLWIIFNLFEVSLIYNTVSFRCKA